MSLKIVEREDNRILELEASGKLVHSDFQTLEPIFNQFVERHAKIRVLLTMLDFHGWEGIALWDEVRFDLKHFGQIERLALVGDKKWEKVLSEFSRPFTTADVRYFNEDAGEEARSWVQENTPNSLVH